MACGGLRRGSRRGGGSSRSRGCLGTCCRRRSGSRRSSMPTMAAALGSSVPHRVVHSTPVGRLDVLPGLVVRECGRVPQGRRGCPGVGRVGLGGRHERQPHEGGRSHPGGFLFHFRSLLNRRLGRPMPVRKTHEPRQASRGGLNGSDGSGRTLLTVRDEAGRRGVEMREDGSDGLRLSSGRRAADHAGHRAES